MVSPLPRAVRGPRSLSPIDSLLLFAVGAVLCLVSLPRLSDYVCATDQVDARGALGLLGEAGLCAPAREGDGEDLLARIAGDRRLRHRLRDARPVGDSDLVLYHGYYLMRVDAGEGEEGAALVAWPRRAGRTGHQAYAWRAGRGLTMHPNRDGRWSGPTPRPDLADPGWGPPTPHSRAAAKAAISSARARSPRSRRR